MAKEAYKIALSEHMTNLQKFVKRPDGKDNKGSYLGEIFTWQEIGKYADDRLKQAWRAVVENDLIPADDDMRERYDEDEHIVVESNAFSMIVTVGKPRETFDQEKFIATVARKYKIDLQRLEQLAATCKKESRAPLTKRIREV
jgi:hypothetical protein